MRGKYPTLFDPTFGVHPQALSVAALLGTTEQIMGGEGDDEIDQEMLDGIEIKTFPDHNGREHGIIIEVSYWIGQKAACIAFGENRNSDDTYVATWVGEKAYNQPTYQDMPEEAYAARQYFGPRKISEAADYIRGLIRGYIVQMHREHYEGLAKKALTV